jgi:hypothetical protein
MAGEGLGWKLSRARERKDEDVEGGEEAGKGEVKVTGLGPTIPAPLVILRESEPPAFLMTSCACLWVRLLVS